jgi:phosphatidylglycerophosphate synthase
MPKDDNQHDGLMKARDSFFEPVSKFLSGLRLTPNMVSIGGVVFMVLFVISFERCHVLGIIFFALGVIADWIDGPLARHQKNVSAKGRLVDIFSDAASFCYFIVGMMLWKILGVWVGVALAASIFVSTVVSTHAAMRHARQRGLKFENIRGFWFFPGLAKVMLYGLFVTTAYRFVPLTNVAAGLMSIVLIISSLTI